MDEVPGMDPWTGGSPEVRGTFGQRFWPLYLLGLVGVATLPFILVPMMRAAPLPPELSSLPAPALALVSMINPVLFLTALTALGAYLAPRVGIRSLVVERFVTRRPVAPDFREAAPLAVGAGLAAGVLIVLLDAAIQPVLSFQWREAAARAAGGTSAGTLLSGLLYGGVTEEIMLRWGLMPLFAWVGWRVFQRGRTAPAGGVVWASILLTALLFGVGHLPAAGLLAPLDAALVARVIVLNAVGGTAFGWLCWRHHLEAGMLAHATANASMAALVAAGLP